LLQQHGEVRNAYNTRHSFDPSVSLGKDTEEIACTQLLSNTSNLVLTEAYD
jgi:hypothetical protein